jgi:hypothetical protein
MTPQRVSSEHRDDHHDARLALQRGRASVDPDPTRPVGSVILRWRSTASGTARGTTTFAPAFAASRTRLGDIGFAAGSGVQRIWTRPMRKRDAAHRRERAGRGMS